jgi:uncharacterized repeat protein (TIGR01451 family)/LPXTG-motif cell wall-anchored protein
LSLIKLGPATAPNVGDTITYQIALSNDGPDPATNITVTDTLPIGLTYDAASIGSDSGATGATIVADGGSAPLLSWSVDSLPAGSSVLLSYAVTVETPTEAPGEYTNVAEVMSADEYDPDSTPGNGVLSEDDHDAYILVSRESDLSVVKTVSAATPDIGDIVTYEITLANAGPEAATNVVVRDDLPAGLSFVAASMTFDSGSTGATIVADDASAPVLRWTIDALPASSSVTLFYMATVRAPTGGANEYLNAAQIVGSDQFDPDSNPASGFGDDDLGDATADDDESAVEIVPSRADVSIVKAAAESRLNIGDRSTITITVANDGPGPAVALEITDLLPPGLAYVAGSIDGDSGVSTAVITPSDAGDPSLVWSIDSLPAGETVQLTYDVDLVAVLSGGVLDPAAYVNAAQVTDAVTWDPDSDPTSGFGVDDRGDIVADDDESQFAFVPYAADLSLVKVVSETSPNVGDVVTFTVTVSNAGPDDATGVSVVDVVPVGYSGVGSVSGGGSFAASMVSWSGLTVAAGGSVVLTYVATVVGGAADYVNVVEVTAVDQFDPDSAPNNDDGDQSEDDEASATVMPAMIGLAKAVAAVVNHADGTFTVSYLLTLENSGDATVLNLEVFDDVVTQFAALAPTGFAASDGTLAANPSWDGTAASNVVAAGQSINPGEIDTVRVAFVVTPGDDLGPHMNSAIAFGTTPTGGSVTDDSTDGTDPDADGDDGDGTVDDDGIPDEDTPTPVSFDEAPVIGTAKSVSSAPTSNGDGSFDLTFTIYVENRGDVDLNGVQVAEDLATTFAAAESWTLLDAISTVFAVSSTYDGSADVDLLLGSDTLAVGASATIEVSARVTPGAVPGPYWNSVMANGASPNGLTVGDVSQDGVDSDPDGNGDPTDNNDPTPVAFPPLGNVAGTVWADVDNDGAIDAGETGIAGVTVTLIDPGPDGLVGTADDIVIGTVVTNPDGSYELIDMPAGDYVAVIDQATLPPAAQASFDPDGVLDSMTPVTISVGDTRGAVDFGYVELFNLVLTKTAAGERQPDENLDFVIMVTNEGPATAIGPITVVDVVPPELPVTGVSADNGSCTITGQTVECVLDGDLRVRETAEITVHTLVAAAAGSEVTNVAVVEATGPVPEIDTADNTDSASVSIGELPYTGSELLYFAIIGLILLSAGLLLVGATRRRERTRA